MASLCVFFFGILAVANNLATVEGVKEFKVGGNEGWHEPAENNTSMYDNWATRMRFYVGDSLSECRFHAVLSLYVLLKHAILSPHVFLWLSLITQKNTKMDRSEDYWRLTVTFVAS